MLIKYPKINKPNEVQTVIRSTKWLHHRRNEHAADWTSLYLNNEKSHKQRRWTIPGSL
ncbi:hypothetical protein NP493_337g02043 [Ridgeia piscesae]|uniref:Uncharacterized protein n=1 Tax=Ridgeia piscesae TaxID=27915 RepID=A0AAD9L3M3_RIDPI|nr:hypothetical protein NP493_337g02043 [Ridgeia piscesae]